MPVPSIYPATTNSPELSTAIAVSSTAFILSFTEATCCPLTKFHIVISPDCWAIITWTKSNFTNVSCRNLGTFSKNLQPLEMYLECLPNDYIQRVFIEISILSHPSKGKNIFPVRIFWFDLSNTNLPQKKLWWQFILQALALALHIKWSFPAWRSSVNVTKPTWNCGSGHSYWRNQK